MVLIINYLFLWKTFTIFEFYEQNTLKKYI